MRSLPIHPIQQRDNYICQYCGKDGLASLDNWHDCTIDHFIPRSYGGTDEAENHVTACRHCNALKGESVFETMEHASSFIEQRRRDLQVVFQHVVTAVRGGVSQEQNPASAFQASRPKARY
jgi:hypothetical protein